MWTAWRRRRRFFTDVYKRQVYTLYLIGNAYSSPQIQMILAESYLD